MEFVQNFTSPDFQVKNFTSSISPNFNSFSKKKHKKISENGEIYTAGNKYYTPAGMDKFHLWSLVLNNSIFTSCQMKWPSQQVYFPLLYETSDFSWSLSDLVRPHGGRHG